MSEAIYEDPAVVELVHVAYDVALILEQCGYGLAADRLYDAAEAVPIGDDDGAA